MSKLVSKLAKPIWNNVGHVWDKSSTLDEPFWMVVWGQRKAITRAEGVLAQPRASLFQLAEGWRGLFQAATDPCWTTPPLPKGEGNTPQNHLPALPSAGNIGSHQRKPLVAGNTTFLGTSYRPHDQISPPSSQMDRNLVGVWTLSRGPRSADKHQKAG